MNTKQLLPPIILSIFLFSGCETSSNVQNKQQTVGLEQQLSNANNKIRKLKQEKYALAETLSNLRHTTKVLKTEKTSRVEESSNLRGQVRTFILHNIDSLKGFMAQGDLLDYTGGAQVPRSNTDTTSLFLVDFLNKMTSEGLLTGVGGVFYQPGIFYVKILRPIGGQYIVIWESKPIKVTTTGKQFLQFPVSVNVERNDIIGYYFPQTVNVGYDISTGDTRYNTSDIPLGGSVSKIGLTGGAEKRAYSLGVYGLMN